MRILTTKIYIHFVSFTTIVKQMKMKIIFATLIMAIILVGSFLFFINKEESVTGKSVLQPVKVKIGYLDIASDLSFFVALDQKYFEKYGLDVEPIKFESSNQVIDALISNKIDGTSIVALEALLSVEEKYPDQFKVFEMTAAEKYTTVHKFLVKKDSNINHLSDLNGKTIGTYPGSQMRVFTELVLQNFIDISTINIVQMAPSLQTQALASGQVDVLFTLEPIGTIAESKGIAKIIAVNPLYKYILKPFPTAASAFSIEFIMQNSETITRYEKAIEEAHQFIEINEKGAKQSLPKYTTINQEIADNVGIYSYWSKEEIDINAVEKLIDLYIKNGIINKEVNPQNIILS